MMENVKTSGNFLWSNFMSVLIFTNFTLYIENILRIMTFS